MVAPDLTIEKLVNENILTSEGAASR